MFGKKKKAHEDVNLVDIPHMGPEICDIHPVGVDVIAEVNEMFARKAEEISAHIKQSEVDAYSGARFDGVVDSVSAHAKALVDIKAERSMEGADDLMAERRHRAVYADALLNVFFPELDKIFSEIEE